MTKQITTVGLDFIAADGRRYTTCQLLKDGKACSGLLANSIPQQFSVAPRGWASIEGGAR
jgi:hypothetical protein